MLAVPPHEWTLNWVAARRTSRSSTRGCVCLVCIAVSARAIHGRESRRHSLRLRVDATDVHGCTLARSPPRASDAVTLTALTE